MQLSTYSQPDLPHFIPRLLEAFLNGSNLSYSNLVILMNMRMLTVILWSLLFKLLEQSFYVLVFSVCLSVGRSDKKIKKLCQTYKFDKTQENKWLDYHNVDSKTILLWNRMLILGLISLGPHTIVITLGVDQLLV